MNNHNRSRKIKTLKKLDFFINSSSGKDSRLSLKSIKTKSIDL